MTTIRIDLPDWLDAAVADAGPLAGDESRISLAINLARRNVAEGTGGPFATLIVRESSGEIVAAGVNVVVPSSTAIAHGEVTAIAAAGQRSGNFDLGASGATGLYTSTEPCLMCLGATVWSGVSRLVIGARDADAAAVGFDEGPKPEAWVEQLVARGIQVVQDVRRTEAAHVLLDYAAGGGPIYNAERQ